MLMFQTIKRLTNKFKPKMVMIKDASGRKLTNPDEKVMMSVTDGKSIAKSSTMIRSTLRLRNDLLCVEWDVKLY